MRITNNLYMLSGSSFSAVNNHKTLGEVYGILTQQGVILIDCGKAKAGPTMLKETLSYFEVDEPITHLILTHAHHDHCGGAKELQDTGTKVIVGKADVDYCINGGPKGTPFDEEQSFPAFIPDTEIPNDQTLEINGLKFEFIMIPGHTQGSMAIRVKLDGKTMLFTGDTLEADGTFLNNFLFGWPGDPSYDQQMIVESIMKLMKYETDMVLSGHGKVCLRNGTDLLRHAAQVAYTTLR